MMSHRKLLSRVPGSRAGLLTTAVLLAASTLQAETAPVAAGKPVPQESRIQQWIRDLGSVDYTTRRDAIQQLQATPIDVLPQLREAGADATLEQSRRLDTVIREHERRLVDETLADTHRDGGVRKRQAIETLRELGPAALSHVIRRIEHLASLSDDRFKADISLLSQLHKTDDEEMQRAVEDALSKLTLSADQKLSAVAWSTLQKELPALAKDARFNRFRFRNRAFNVQVNAQIMAGGPNVRRKQVRIANGKRTVTVEANGQKITIEDNNGKDISVQLEEKKNGKPVKKSWKGKDLADLKKNAPEAAKLYQEHAGANQGIQIFNRVQAIPGRAALPVPVRPAQRPAQPDMKKLKEVREKMQAAQKELHQAIKDGADREEIQMRMEGIRDLSEEMRKAIRPEPKKPQ